MNASEREKLLGRFMAVRDWLYGNPKGDSTEECLRVNAVVTRFPQKCCSVYHGVPKTYAAGTLMIKENAKFDGKFSSAYTCEGCIAESEKELAR
jgi:hypothetical protein